LNFALEEAVMEGPGKPSGLKLNWTHQLLAYVDYVNLLGDSIKTINKNIKILLEASKEVDLEVKVENTKYMLVSRPRNADQNLDIKVVKKIVSKCVIVQVFANDSNKSTFDSQGN
jgi:hypothetical protein